MKNEPDNTKPCPKCGGTGTINEVPADKRRGWNQFPVMCSLCKGWGRIKG